MKLTLWLFLFWCLPNLATANGESKKTACDFLMSQNAELQSRLVNPDYAMEEAAKFLETFKGVPLEVRNKTPIAYFREQIPPVIKMLRELEIPDGTYNLNRYQTGITLEDNVVTFSDAVKLLIEEGARHYRENTATLTTFPDYMLEVTALKHCIRVFKKADLKDFFKSFNKAKNVLKNQRENEGVLHWPTPADVGIRHYRDWHWGVQFLGYRLGATPPLIYDGYKEEDDQDDYNLFEHDITNHSFNSRYMHIAQVIDRIVTKLDSAIKSESDLNHQSVMKVLKYFLTHEQGELYDLINHLVEQEFNKYALREAFRHIREIEVFFERIKSPSDFRSELTAALQKMSDEDLKNQTNAAVKKFENVVIEIFKTYKKP